MADVKLFARQSDGLVVIYQGDTNVIEDPLVDLSRLFLHSNLRYVTVVNVVTGSFDLGAIGHPDFTAINHTLNVHGVDGVPFVFGRLVDVDSGFDGDVTYPWVGHVPVQWPRIYNYNLNNGGSRWLALGADDTNILANEIGINPFVSTTIPAITVNYEVFVTDLILDGDQPALSDIALKISADEFIAQRGLFTTDKQFLQKSGQNTDFVLGGGRTIEMVQGDGERFDGSTHLQLRYSLNGEVREFKFGDLFGPNDNRTSTFNAPAQNVSV